ncbi:MAG TPA: DUF2520 domain-containing protein [Polyangia bacterium]|nr:DUF2520 domain-containing protein [Polyangia bacterium]
MDLLIVGDGPVARALDANLARAGAAPARWWRKRGGKMPQAGVALLAVSDRAIAEAAAEVVRAQAAPPVLLHCAGALPPDEVFAGLGAPGVGLLHPLTSIATGAETLERVHFAIQGDLAGRSAARAIVALVGGAPLELPEGADALAGYHAAAALVSNAAVALVDAGVELFASLGLERAGATRALAALLDSTARNLSSVGLPDALTGPIARGDAGVVERHLRALAAHPALDALYRATARRVTKVAVEKGRADAESIAKIRKLLGFTGSPDLK